MAVNTETWDQEAQWDVEKIIGHKDVDPVTGFPKVFKIKWLGWEDRFSLFEPLENLACTELLADYLKSHQVSADEATRLRSYTGQQAPRKQVSAPRRRGRNPASKSAHTSDHTCALVNGKVECDYKVLCCTTDVRDDADGNMVVHHGSRGLLAPSTSKPVQSTTSGKEKRTKAKRAVTAKKDKVQKRKCAERKTRVDKADKERDFFNSMQKRVSPRGGNALQQVDTFRRPSDSSDDLTDDDESLDLGIPQIRTALPVIATDTPAVSSQKSPSITAVHRRVVGRADRFKKPEASTRLSDSSTASGKSSDDSSVGSSGRSRKSVAKSPAKSSEEPCRPRTRMSVAKSPVRSLVKSPGHSPLRVKRRLFTSNIKTTPPQRDSRSTSAAPISTADRPRLILKVPNPKKGHPKIQNRSRSGSSSSNISSAMPPPTPTPPQASTFAGHSWRPRCLSRSVSPSVSRTKSRSLSSEIMPPPAPTAGTSRLNNGTLLSELAKIARSKSALARGPSRAPGYENRRELTRRFPSPVSRSKSVMVQKPVKRTVSSPARNERPTKKTRRPAPSNRLAKASAASSRVTRRRR